MLALDTRSQVSVSQLTESSRQESHNCIQLAVQISVANKEATC